MATYTKETALYDTGAIANDIGEAGETATNYLTNISGGGVYVHSSDTSSDPTDNEAQGVLITDQIDIIRDGTSVAEFGASARIGSDQSSNIVLEEEGITAKKEDGTEYFVIGTTSSTISQYASRSDRVATPDGQSGLSGTAYLANAPYADLYNLIETGAGIQFIVRAKVSYWTTTSYPQRYVTTTMSDTVSASGLKKGTSYYQSLSNRLCSYISYNASTPSCYMSINASYIENRYGSSSHPWKVTSISIELAGNIITPAPSYEFGTEIEATKPLSFGINQGTVPSSYGFAMGKYNKRDTNNAYAFIIGNGTANNSRSDALTVGWNGNIKSAGTITDGNGNSIPTRGYFYANSVTATTISSTSTPTKVPITGISTASGFEYDSTNKGIKCTEAGTYMISVQQPFNPATSGDLIGLSIYKNGVQTIGIVYTRIGGNYDTAYILPTIIVLAEGDYLTLYAQNNTASRGQTQTATRFSAWKVD